MLTKEHQTRKPKGKLTPSQINKLDTLFQIKVLENAAYGSILGGTAEVAHHFIARDNFATRWYLPNGIPITNSQHQYSDLNEQVEEIMGKEWLQDIYRQARKAPKYITYQDVIDYIMGFKENYL